MNVLFIHQNFPGQFRHIALHLAQLPGVDVRAIGREHAPGLAEIKLYRYRPHRQAGVETHPYVRSFENGALHGQQVLRLLLELKASGYSPDVIVAHPGWGETLYAKLAFPACKLLHFCEYYYRIKGADVDFDPEFPMNLDRAAGIHSANALHLLNLESCDAGITSTHWQHSLHPAAYRSKIKVVHEGIEVDALKPNPAAQLTLPNGMQLKAGDPVVTYVARNLEPYRGFHSFMRMLPHLLAAHGDCQVVIVGGDEVSYGSKPGDAPNWRTKLLRENAIDLGRVHFLGRVDTATYRTLLQVSAAHVYLTYPFVLSWSLLEALASGCLVIASDTAPVREVMRDGENGWLVDFFDCQTLLERILEALAGHPRAAEIRAQARCSVQPYTVTTGIEQYRQMIEQLVGTPFSGLAPVSNLEINDV